MRAPHRPRCDTELPRRDTSLAAGVRCRDLVDATLVPDTRERGAEPERENFIGEAECVAPEQLFAPEQLTDRRNPDFDSV